MTEETHPQGPGETKPGRPSYGRVLRQPAFLRVWLAQLVSQSGDFIFEVALIWFVLETTRSVLDVGIVVTGTILPAVVIGPFLGVYLDRWDRKRVLVGTNLLEGGVVAVLAFLVLEGVASLWVIFGIVLVLGAGARLVGVATEAYVPSFLAVEDLTPANSLLSLSGSFNQIVALSVGGVVVALFGVTIPMEYDTLTFFAAALLLLSVHGPTRPATPAPGTSRSSFFTEFREGFAFVRDNRFMLEIIVIGMLVNFFGNAMSALFAPYAAFVLHGGATVYGLLGASVAAGSLGGAVAIGNADTRKSAGRFLLAGGMGVGLIVLAVGLVSNIPLALALMVGLGITITVTNLPMQTLLQAKVPDRLRGRVMSAFFALVMATGPMGPLAAGWMASRWSVAGALVISGAAITVVIALGALTMRSLRDVEY